MLSKYSVLAIMFFSFLGLLQSQEKKNKFKESLNASLVVEMDVSYEFDSEQLQKTELFVKPEFSYRINKRSKIIFKGIIYSELNDNLESGVPNEETVSDFSKRLFIGDRTSLELRELYYYTNIRKKVRLTIGKQQIVWGETDGLKLLDVVNPQNFREFILDDFEDSRIPLWSVKAEFDIKNIGVQLVWVPDNTYHIIPELDAPYFPKSLFRIPPDGIETVFNKIVKPNSFIADSDIGFKVSTFTKGWDLSLNYFYYFDDLPVFYNYLDTSEAEPFVSINPKFERQHLIGGTFNKVFGSATLRGELTYIFNQNFSSINQSAIRGIETSNVYKSAIGIDYIKGENVVSFQLFSDIITEDINAYNRDKFETNTSLLLSHEMMNDNLKGEVLWVHNVNHGDGFVRPKLSYWVNSSSQLFLGSDLFYGNSNKLYGQIKDRNRVSFGMSWGM